MAVEQVLHSAVVFLVAANPSKPPAQAEVDKKYLTIVPNAANYYYLGIQRKKKRDRRPL